MASFANESFNSEFLCSITYLFHILGNVIFRKIVLFGSVVDVISQPDLDGIAFRLAQIYTRKHYWNNGNVNQYYRPYWTSLVQYNDNDNEIFFIAMKLHNVHSIYKTTHI